MAQPNGVNLVNNSDNPAAAQRAGQKFWRYQSFYTQTYIPGVTSPTLLPYAPYIYLGAGCVPNAIVLGPNSSIDTVRAWYVPPFGSSAYFQDISVNSPVVAPLAFNPNTVQINGTDVDPGVYIFFGDIPDGYDNDKADFFGNFPVAPRTLMGFSLSGTAGGVSNFQFPVQYLDLIVYFSNPVLSNLRAPVNAATFINDQSPGSGDYVSGATRSVDCSDATANPLKVWCCPTYGRARLQQSFSVSGLGSFKVYGHNYGTTDQLVQTLEDIRGAASYKYSPVDFEYMYMVCDDMNLTDGDTGAVDYDYQAWD